MVRFIFLHPNEAVDLSQEHCTAPLGKAKTHSYSFPGMETFLHTCRQMWHLKLGSILADYLLLLRVISQTSLIEFKWQPRDKILACESTLNDLPNRARGEGAQRSSETTGDRFSPAYSWVWRNSSLDPCARTKQEAISKREKPVFPFLLPAFVSCTDHFLPCHHKSASSQPALFFSSSCSLYLIAEQPCFRV